MTRKPSPMALCAKAIPWSKPPAVRAAHDLPSASGPGPLSGSYSPRPRSCGMAENGRCSPRPFAGQRAQPHAGDCYLLVLSMTWVKALRVPAEFSAQLLPDGHWAFGPDWCWGPGLMRCLLYGLDDIVGARMPSKPCGEASFLHCPGNYHALVGASDDHPPLPAFTSATSRRGIRVSRMGLRTMTSVEVSLSHEPTVALHASTAIAGKMTSPGTRSEPPPLPRARATTDAIVAKHIPAVKATPSKRPASRTCQVIRSSATPRVLTMVAGSTSGDDPKSHRLASGATRWLEQGRGG